VSVALAVARNYFATVDFIVHLVLFVLYFPLSLSFGDSMPLVERQEGHPVCKKLRRKSPTVVQYFD